MAPVVGTDIYGTFAQAQAYHAMRGNTAWATMQEADGDVFLVKATDWIERTFYGQWRGEYISGNVLAWPRDEAMMDDGCTLITGIPDLLVRTMAAVAEIYRSGTDLDQLLTDDAAVKSEKVDGAVEIEYDVGSRLRGAPVPIHVYRMIEPLLVGGGQLMRA